MKTKKTHDLRGRNFRRKTYSCFFVGFRTRTISARKKAEKRTIFRNPPSFPVLALKIASALTKTTLKYSAVHVFFDNRLNGRMTPVRAEGCRVDGT